MGYLVKRRLLRTLDWRVVSDRRFASMESAQELINMLMGQPGGTEYEYMVTTGY